VFRVLPGEHAVSVFAEGGEWWEGDVTVRMGEVVRVGGRLREPVTKVRR